MVAQEINKVMLGIQLHQIFSKIERIHRSAIESDWGFSEDIKSNFIKAQKHENPIYVSQTNSLTITSHQNDAMKKKMQVKKQRQKHTRLC